MTGKVTETTEVLEITEFDEQNIVDKNGGRNHARASKRITSDVDKFIAAIKSQLMIQKRSMSRQKK